jgi:Fe-S-cluster containining protein
MDESEGVATSSNNGDQISRVRRLCHQLFGSACVKQKREGQEAILLQQRPHWSVQKRGDQFQKIDQGENIPFDIALPLPARDAERPDSDDGVKLFWERFRCQHCGRCCFTPGAGLCLEKEDFERIAGRVGQRRLRALCKYDKSLGIWILRQPCPFYDKRRKECEIYDVRPQTCAKYPLHPPLKEMPCNLAVDAFCPAARQLAKETLSWWIICENNWARLLERLQRR